MKQVLKFTGDEPLNISVGNYGGRFEPGKQYPIEHPNFANFLLGREDFRLAENQTIEELSKLPKEELLDMAKDAGIENPEQLGKKANIAEAIVAKNTVDETAEVESETLENEDQEEQDNG